MTFFANTYSMLNKNIDLIIMQPNQVRTCRTPGGALRHSFNSEVVEAECWLHDRSIDSGARCAMARAIADLHELIVTCSLLDVYYSNDELDTLDGKYLETAREARRQIRIIRTMSEVRAS